MKIKQTLFALIILLGLIIVLTLPSQTYAQCGGVDTSIINCEQKGQCDGGENPFEGTDPGSDSDKQAEYVALHHHSYGLCMGDEEPSMSVTDTGLWGILLIAINILTSGVGILAIGGIVYGSILYTSAGGSSEQIKKATTVFTNVVIGVVAYAIMYAFLNFIIPGGVFN